MSKTPSFRHLLSSMGAAIPRPAAAMLLAPPPPPPNFPPTIPLALDNFENWSTEIQVPNQWIATPANDQDVVTLANWAKSAGYTLRALGQRHNWSPLVLPTGAPVVLVSTVNLAKKQFNAGANPTATFGAGVTVEDATQFLETQNNGGASPAPGYSFLNMTAPGDLTLGGVLAIGAHGTGLPLAGEPDLGGCLSNLISEFTAVVDTGGGYALKKFKRTDPGATAFLVHLGRAFLTEVTLAVVPNYYLQVESSYPRATTLFEAPSATPSPHSMTQLVASYGRVEAIWFPFTDNPWVKTWQRMPNAVQPQVGGPYNYGFANNISAQQSADIGKALHAFPPLTPAFEATELLATMIASPSGAPLNGTARDLLLYVKPTTIRVTALGYAIVVPRAKLQETVHAFYVKYHSLLEHYALQFKFPMNSAVEIRVTTVDRTAALGIAGAQPPQLSAATPDSAATQNDIVVWLDALTMAATPHANEFYTELETFILNKWGTAARPEWSKAWAFTPAGAWTNGAILSATIPAAYANFAAAKATLASHDAGGVFTNALLAQLL
jgi:hypothetical protein